MSCSKKLMTFVFYGRDEEMESKQVFNTAGLKDLLRQNRAQPIGDPKGNFLEICRQDFRLPSGETQTREFIKKQPASVVVPLTQNGKLVFVLQPVGLCKEGSLIEFPAGYWNFREDGRPLSRSGIYPYPRKRLFGE